MEDINETDITDQILGNLSTHKSISKPKNIFKLFFFISIFILLIVIISFCFIFFNKKIYQSSNNNTSQIVSTITPTEVIDQIKPTNSPEIETLQKVSFIKDDKNAVSKLITTDENNKETLISEVEYFNMDGTIIKPEYRFVFSSDNNFLYYTLSGYEGGFSGLYNIQNKINKTIPFLSSSANFNDSNNYFYSCDEGGISGGGAVIYKLPELSPIYEKEGSFYCEYNRINNSLKISEDSNSGQSIEYFSFTSGSF